MYNNKDTILQSLLSLAREIQSFVSIFPNVDDNTYQLKVIEIQSQVRSILFGYTNQYIASSLSSKIQLINLSYGKNNASKLLEICSEILNLGQMINLDRRW